MILKKQRITYNKMFVCIALIAFATSTAGAQEDDRERSHEAHRAAFDACLEELGLPKPVRGERPQAPDEEMREKVDACLKEKGFEPPKLGRGGPKGSSGGIR